MYRALVNLSMYYQPLFYAVEQRVDRAKRRRKILKFAKDLAIWGKVK